MRIGLIDLDSKMPIIPLMKIKSYYKDKCEWFNGFSQYDKVYISKLFNFTRDYEYIINAKKIIKGGTGFNIESKLPEKIEKCQPNYCIYPECNYSIQRFSIGCIRACKFCIVNKKEGFIKMVNPMNLNPKGNYIEILDNNFFANPEWIEAIKYLIKTNQPVNFHGIDIRIINEDQCNALNKLKHYKQIHIAWDNPKENIVDKIKIMLKYIKPYKIMCYVLIGFNSTEQEDIYRVEKLRELNIDPFIMPYKKKDKYQKSFARWVNHKAIFMSIKWKDYKK